MKRSKDRQLELSPNEQVVVARLLQGEKVSQIAKAMGKHVSYISRITKRPHIQALVNGHRGDLMYKQWQQMSDLVPLWLLRAEELLSIPVNPARPDAKLLAVQAAVGKDLLDRLGLAHRSAPQGTPTDQVAITFDTQTAADLLSRLRAPAQETIIDVQNEQAQGGGHAAALPSGDPDPSEPGEPGVPPGAGDD